VILRMEDGSQWREVVGGCNPRQRLGEKWSETTTIGAGGPAGLG